MKKALLGLLLVMASMGIMAQAHTWYVAILPGYQFSTGNYQYNYSDGPFVAKTNGSGENNFCMSLDGGYYFTKAVGLHFAYYYNEGNYSQNVHFSYPGVFDYYDHFKLKRNVNLFEIGPEFAHTWNACHQIYGQINVGYTFGGGTTWAYYQGHRYNAGNLGENDWVYGAAFGYRFWFSDNAAFCVQGAYHHVANWDINDIWDARVGVAFKF